MVEIHVNHVKKLCFFAVSDKEKKGQVVHAILFLFARISHVCYLDCANFYSCSYLIVKYYQSLSI